MENRNALKIAEAATELEAIADELATICNPLLEGHNTTTGETIGSALFAISKHINRIVDELAATGPEET